MSVPPENTSADPEQLIADLQRHFAECKAKRDEAPQREIGTRGGVAGHQFLARRPRASIHDPPAARQALGNDKGCHGHSSRGNAERWGGRAPYTDFTDYPRA